MTHFGVQTGIGAWQPTLLETLGHEASGGALLTSAFWFAMVVGQFLAAGLTQWISIPVLVTTSCACTTVAVTCATYDNFAAPALISTGFFIGPIFGGR